MDESIYERKSEHIRIVLGEKVTGDSVTTGFEKVTFVHQALPEIDFDDITIDTDFLSFTCKTPFIVSSMTGGPDLTEKINRNLAIAAEQRGWILSLGSTRALIEGDGLPTSFQLRTYAPTIPIVANLGAVQLNYQFGPDECKKIAEITDANVFVFHLNSIQEVIQPEGNRNFKGLLSKIEKVCKEMEIPVGVKEVGWGIDGTVARRLFDVGVAFIDVAGAGGTSWSQVEKYRTKDPVKRIAAKTFNDWGNPTTECILDVRKENGSKPIVASGGIHTGLDAAKALALGADMVGIARGLLRAATKSEMDVITLMETREFELKLAMFGIGVSTIAQLKRTDRIRINQ